MMNAVTKKENLSRDGKCNWKDDECGCKDNE